MKDKLIEFVSIQLDKDLKEPLYVQLYEQIKLMIKQHLLSPGYKLPAVRNLAQNLQVNPSTVVNAYKELEKNGFIFSKRGSGSYVAEQVINTIDELEELVYSLEPTAQFNRTMLAEQYYQSMAVTEVPDEFEIVYDVEEIEDEEEAV